MRTLTVCMFAVIVGVSSSAHASTFDELMAPLRAEAAAREARYQAYMDYLRAELTQLHADATARAQASAENRRIRALQEAAEAQLAAIREQTRALELAARRTQAVQSSTVTLLPGGELDGTLQGVAPRLVRTGAIPNVTPQPRRAKARPVLVPGSLEERYFFLFGELP